MKYPFAIALVVVAIGILLTDSLHLSLREPTPIDFENDITPPLAEALVISTKETSSGTRMEVSINALTDKEKRQRMPIRNTHAYLTCRDKSFSPGDRILFFHKLSPITADMNHRGSEKWLSLLRHRNILYRQTLRGKEVILEGHSTTLKSLSTEIRDAIAVKIERSRMETDTKRFLVTVLLGDSDVLTDEDREGFANAGIAHILALSGMHIAIIVGIFLWLLAPLSLCLSFRWRYIVTLIFLWGYAFITGMSPSVVRASVMATFLFIAIICQRRNNALNALCAAVTCILLVDPASLYHPGLQLSFFSVATILVFVNKERKEPLVQGGIAKTVYEGIVVSLVAVIGTWVLTSYYFGNVPLFFLPVNILVVPILPAYVSVAIVHTFLLCCGVDLKILQIMLDAGRDALGYIVELVNNKGITWEFEASLIGVFIWSACILVAMWVIKKRLPRWSLAMIGVAGILGVIITEHQEPDMVIFRNYPGGQEIAIYQGKREELVSMPENGTTTAEICGKRVVYVDENSISLAEKSKDKDGIEGDGIKDRCDILIIGKGYRGSVGHLLRRYAPQKILIGAGHFGEHAESLLQESYSLGLPAHQLPYREALTH